jgi:hypothetical protein
MDRFTAAPVGRSGGPRAGRRRRSLLGVGGVGLAILLVLSACDAGQDAATTPGVPDVTAVHGGVGDMALAVVFIESGGIVEAGASVPLRGAFTNADGAPNAQGIQIPAEGEVDGDDPAPRVALPPHR